jgi:predicted ATP-dependent endonuclease of OLD family
MKLVSVRLQNFRAFEDETVDLSNYTCLVGANGTGKSTVLTALRVFFRDTTDVATDLVNLTKEDFFKKDTTRTITITLTFETLSEKAQEDFKDYYRGSKLIVSAVAEWSADTGLAPVLHKGQRFVHPDFKVYFAKESDGESAQILKDTYAKIRAKYPDLPDVKVKAQMAGALREYEEKHPEECKTALSNDQFYGFSKGTNLLEKYIQWVYVPAVKDASSEEMEARTSVLGKLLERTVRTKLSFTDSLEKIKEDSKQQYDKLLKDNEAALKELSSALNKRIQDWGHPQASLNIVWHADANKAVSIAEPTARSVLGESGFTGMVARLGHGLQRSYLLALLQELAGADDAEAPRLILACEEPELYQHPPQARHLAGVFEKLSESNTQVLLCTHSPYFVSGGRFEDVRVFRKASGTGATHSHLSLTKLAETLAEARGGPAPTVSAMAAKVEQVLRAELSELFFSPVIILVEGVEDAAYLRAYLTLSDQWHEYRRRGCHIVPTNGKSNMAYPLAIAKGLSLPVFTVFDADADETDPGKMATHKKDNTALLKLLADTDTPPMPEADSWFADHVVWQTNIGDVLAKEIGKDDWNTIRDKVRSDHDFNVKNLNKNTMFIGHAVAAAWEQGKKSTSLERLCKAILDFAKSADEEGEE